VTHPSKCKSLPSEKSAANGPEVGATATQGRVFHGESGRPWPPNFCKLSLGRVKVAHSTVLAKIMCNRRKPLLFVLLLFLLLFLLFLLLLFLNGLSLETESGPIMFVQRLPGVRPSKGGIHYSIANTILDPHMKYGSTNQILAGKRGI
jgi:hypothetical protein